MLFKRKKKHKARLLKSFGEIKDDSFDFGWIEKYFRNKDHSDAFQVISDKTCNDLDFQDLFRFLDRTNSKVGQQFLYNKLRIIPSSSESLEKFEELIEKFSKDETYRVAIQLQLEKLNNHESFYINSLFQDQHLQPSKWHLLLKLLSFTSVFSLIMLIFNQQLFVVCIGVYIINTGIHYWNKRSLYQYLSSIPQLLKLNQIAHKLFKDEELKKINPDLQKSIHTIDSISRRMSIFKLEANMQGDFDIIFWAIFELIKIPFLIEPLILFSILRKIETKRKEIETVYSFIGQLDTLISIASLRKGLENYCTPIINENRREIIAIGIVHPLIDKCISNTLKLIDKSFLLTGSNMSGKTSFIRTIGINLITGLTINTCFAKSISLPRTRIFSAIRISDDLMNNKSYYFEEVLTIKEMIDNSLSSKPNLFLLDEIFKGTNTIERISAGKAVLSSLSNDKNIVLVSTHDIELADLLNKKYDLYHFSEIVSGENIAFDYKLKEGKLKNRNAIRILQINNYPEHIIKEAIELSEELDKNKSA